MDVPQFPEGALVNQNLKRKIAVSVAGVTVLAGGGIAFAATQSSPQDERKALLDNAAKRLNVSPDQLSAALQGAFEDQLDKAVADGRLTKERADAIKARLKAHGGVPLGPPIFGGPGGPGGRFGHGFRVGPGGPHGPHGIDAAAKYLGLTEAKLHEQLESGKSLADVAKAQGKDVEGLKKAIVDAAKADLDKAVADKRLTDAQRDQMVKDLESHVDDLVAGKGPRFRGGRRGHFGPGRPGMPPPPPATPENGANEAPEVTGQSPA